MKVDVKFKLVTAKLNKEEYLFSIDVIDDIAFMEDKYINSYIKDNILTPYYPDLKDYILKYNYTFNLITPLRIDVYSVISKDGVVAIKLK